MILLKATQRKKEKEILHTKFPRGFNGGSSREGRSRMAGCGIEVRSSEPRSSYVT